MLQGLDEFDIGHHLVEVGLQAIAHVVDDHNLDALGKEGANKVASNESSPSRDKSALHGAHAETLVTCPAF